MNRDGRRTRDARTGESRGLEWRTRVRAHVWDGIGRNGPSFGRRWRVARFWGSGGMLGHPGFKTRAHGQIWAI